MKTKFTNICKYILEQMSTNFVIKCPQDMLTKKSANQNKCRYINEYFHDV